MSTRWEGYRPTSKESGGREGTDGGKEDTSSVICLHSGKFFDMLRPERYGELDIEDIAHGLSLICRYGGQCKEFYSVAEHSLRVTDLVGQLWKETTEGEDASPLLLLTALLHDASEAFIGDVITPLKRIQEMEAYRCVEQAIEETISRQWGLLYPLPEIVRNVDRLCMYVEMKEFLHRSIEELVTFPLDLREFSSLDGFPGPRWETLPSKLARVMFIRRYQQLKNAIHYPCPPNAS